MRESMIKLHHVEPASRVNGPGLRAVVWVQGCGLGCPGCFNPETHTFEGGQDWPVEKLAEWILQLKEPVQGITISGGEPLQQQRALARLFEQVRQVKDLSIVVFSGYTWQEIQKFPDIERFLAPVDVLLAGRFDASQRVARGLIGSSNKTVHFLSPRYTLDDLASVPQAEVIVEPDGEIRLSGIEPLQW